MTKSGIKVTFIIEKRKAEKQPLEYIVETGDYDAALKTAKKRLVSKGIDPDQYKRVVMAEIWILEVDSDG